MPVSSEDVQRHSVHTLVFRSLKRTHDMFLCDQGMLPPSDDKAENFRKNVKLRVQYGPVLEKVKFNKKKAESEAHVNARLKEMGVDDGSESYNNNNISSGTDAVPQSQSMALVPSVQPTTGATPSNQNQIALQMKKAPVLPKPKWHPPWKLARVISGHTGWVRCVAVEPGNEWFVTGANDRIIKVWDLASGQLKLSLTGHVSSVRGLAVSARHPYLFSCGEDKQVKCWDLEYNKVCLVLFGFNQIQRVRI